MRTTKNSWPLATFIFGFVISTILRDQNTTDRFLFSCNSNCNKRKQQPVDQQHQQFDVPSNKERSVPVLEPVPSSSSFDQSKPYFVIHCGPPKTGTTTLQTSLHKIYKRPLELDNYVYEGKFIQGLGRRDLYKEILNGVASAQCMSAIQRSKNNNVPQCWTAFLSRLDQLNGTSIIISEETLGFYQKSFGSPQYWNMLQDALSKRYNVMVVITYRRYFHWLMSVKSMLEQTVFRKPLKRVWHDDGGWNAGPTTTEWLVKVMEQPDFDWDYTDKLKDFYQRHDHHRFRTIILNMHNGQDPVTTFLCDVLPRASHACERAMALSAEQKKLVSNPSKELTSYHRITFAIRERYGRYKTHKIRQKVFEGVRRYMIENQVTYPINNCPNATQVQPILEKSIVMERLLLGGAAAEELLKTEFWHDFVPKLCDVDTHAALQDQGLIQHLIMEGALQL